MTTASTSTGAGAASDSNSSTVVFSFVYSGLTGAGIDSRNAAKYALFCQHLHAYIQGNPQVQSVLQQIKDAKDAKDVGEGARKAVQAQRLLSNAGEMGLTSAVNGLRNVRGAGAAAVLSVFVDRFASYARAQDIELNECSLAVAKVSLDFAGVMVGGATAVSGWGLVLAGFSVLSMFDDSYQLGKACLANL